MELRTAARLASVAVSSPAGPAGYTKGKFCCGLLRITIRATPSTERADT